MAAGRNDLGCENKEAVHAFLNTINSKTRILACYFNVLPYWPKEIICIIENVKFQASIKKENIWLETQFPV